jgi:hypothetical protein
MIRFTPYNHYAFSQQVLISVYWDSYNGAIKRATDHSCTGFSREGNFKHGQLNSFREGGRYAQGRGWVEGGRGGGELRRERGRREERGRCVHSLEVIYTCTSSVHMDIKNTFPHLHFTMLSFD